MRQTARPRSPAPEGGGDAGLAERLRYPAAALTGIFMVLAFPRYGLDWLIWIALVPLFWAAAGAGLRRGFLAGWLAGLTLEGAGFSWVLHSLREFSGLGPLASFLFWPWLLYESLPWGLLGLALGALPRPGQGPGEGGSRSAAWIFAAIPLWAALEHFYPRVFPWQVGGALFDRPWLVQCADLLGAGGLTALVLLVNGTIHLGILRARGQGRFPIRSLGLTAALLAGANIYGSLRLDQVSAALEGAPELRVGIIQTAAAPAQKSPEALEDALIAFEKMKALTRALAQQGPMDLAVWPEGADPIGFIIDRAGKLNRRVIIRDKPRGFEELEVPLVAGTATWSERSGGSRNTAEYVLPGKWPPGLYHKNKLLLFGETVPFWSLLPESVRAKFPYVGSFEAGTDCPLFALPARGGPFRFRALICYEAVLPRYVQAAAREAHFLVNVTEDIWYGDTSHIGQHLSVLKLRAVEQRISIVRCANVGPSGVIDPAGRMADPTMPYQKTERIFALHPARCFSFYGSLGQAFPWACLGIAAALFGARAFRRKR